MEFIRFRRLRRTSYIRDLVSQTHLSVENLVMPYFVVEGEKKKELIKSMPGFYRLSLDQLLEEVKEVKELGIRAILLFGVANKKDKIGSYSFSEEGIVQRAVGEIKKEIRDIVVITDVCLCGYTSHGHCGIVKEKDGFYFIYNDATLEILGKIALSHAKAGVDFVAPSSMMDGQVKTIREILDKNGFEHVGILAYSAKYASNFYGPFREALDSFPQFGNRKSYQMDFRNSNEALRGIASDIEEGADIVMIKPALCYLDIIYRAKEKFNVPIAVYNVSGEYTMIKRLAEEDRLKEKELVLEVLTSIKRAGGDLIITYFAKDVGR